MKKANQYTKIRSKLKYFCFLVLYFFLYPICKLLYGRKRNWVICERKDEAQDNGYVFFKYLIAKHPEIKPIYLIDKKCDQFKNVSALGKVVQFGTLKHLMVVIGCPVKISSQLFGYAPWVQLKTYYRRNKTHDVHVFLQHGITKNMHEGLFSESCRSLKVFLCGAKPEYDYIFKDFHYENDVPQYTGFPRYDLLNNFAEKNQIIIMPTWRANLDNLSDESFKQTMFFNCWSKLINDDILNGICLKNNLIIKFYMHHSFKQYLHLFKGGKAVKIIGFGEENVQELLKESKLLITDFSSVYFDFAYMNKPTIYFQFDEKEYYSKHYLKGYFDYRRDGFGGVCINKDEVIDEFTKIVSDDFSVEHLYSSRADRFFVRRDCNNCERVFNAILRIK